MGAIARKRQALAAGLLGLLLLVGCGHSPPVPPAVVPLAADQPRPLSERDRRFVLDAAGSGLYLVEAAQIAEQRSQDPIVKAYAVLLRQQQAVANEELRALTEARRIPWLGGPPADRREVLDGLTAVAPELFDRSFVERVGVADRQADVVLYEAAALQLDDPVLRSWAERMLPMLHNHLAMARQLPMQSQAVAWVSPGLDPGLGDAGHDGSHDPICRRDLVAGSADFPAVIAPVCAAIR